MLPIRVRPNRPLQPTSDEKIRVESASSAPLAAERQGVKDTKSS